MRSGFACDNDDDDEERQLEYFSTEQTGRGTRLLFRHVFERNELPPPFLSFFPLFSSRKGHLFVDTQDGRRKVQSNSGTKNSKKDPPRKVEIRRSMKRNIHFPR